MVHFDFKMCSLVEFRNISLSAYTLEKALLERDERNVSNFAGSVKAHLNWPLEIIISQHMLTYKCNLVS